MIESFAKQNQSKIVRPPKLFASLPWDDQKRYEALVLEYVDGPLVVKAPTDAEQLKRFYEIYREYRANCIQQPWLEKPRSNPEALRNSFQKWRVSSQKIYPNNPLRQPGDWDLIDQAVNLLVEQYQGVEPEFVHGHFSTMDLYQQGEQVVVLSNLYWSWRLPFYDAVFGYHWFMYQLNGVKDITPEQVEEQR